MLDRCQKKNDQWWIYFEFANKNVYTQTTCVLPISGIVYLDQVLPGIYYIFNRYYLYTQTVMYRELQFRWQ